MNLSMFILLFFLNTCWSQTVPNYTVDIGVDTPLREVNERYLSVGLDTNLIYEKFENGSFDFTSTKMLTLARELGNCYLRIGGTKSAYVVFDPNSYANYDLEPDRNNFTMTTKDWDNLNQFALKSGWRFLFDLNVLIRSNGKWDPKNAKELFDYSIQKGYHSNQDWELGNEPNSMPGALNFTLPATNLSVDFRTLQSVLQSDEYRPYYGNSYIMGPDATQNKNSAPPYLRDFLPGMDKVLHAVTVHHYYKSGKLITLEDMMNPVVMDSLETELGRLQEVIYSIMPQDTRVWLGETSSAYGGGQYALTDTFAASFLWMDKLGLGANIGVDLISRQTFFGKHYALLSKELYPNPDYWLSYIYKRLVGTKVLTARKTTPVGGFRVYAHCAKSGEYPAGAITVFAMNVYNYGVTFNLAGLENQEVYMYYLSAHSADTENGIKTQLVDLNGRLLQMPDDQTMPRIEPLISPTAEHISLPAETLAFYVLPNAQAPACM